MLRLNDNSQKCEWTWQALQHKHTTRPSDGIAPYQKAMLPSSRCNTVSHMYMIDTNTGRLQKLANYAVTLSYLCTIRGIKSPPDNPSAIGSKHSCTIGTRNSTFKIGDSFNSKESAFRNLQCTGSVTQFKCMTTKYDSLHVTL